MGIRRSRAVLIALCACLGLPAFAPTAAAAVCRKATGSGMPPPVVKLSVAGAYTTQSGSYSAAGERLRFYGRIDNADLAGEKLRLRIYSGSSQIRFAVVNARPLGCSSATFSYRSNIWRAGRMTWRVTHLVSAQAPEFTKVAGGPVVYRLARGFGSRGTGVGVLLSMLRGLGYYAPRGNSYGAGTGKAVLAYRKVNRMARIETPSRRIYHLLQAGRGTIHARYPRLGTHLEADLSRQVLVFYTGSTAREIHPISSGKPSTPTVLGKYRFYMREPGTNGHGMVDSVYFYNGYAVHGYAELPTYAASHGCLRTWVPSARHIYNRIRLGEWIAVFR